MRRLSVLSLVALASLGAISGPASGAPMQLNPSHARVEIKLRASDGLTAKLENDGKKVSLTVHRRRQTAEYTVLHGKVSPDGVEARFGKLGEVSVEFQPTRTIETTKPFPGCQGDPWTTKVGSFVGTIHFRGEGGYVKIDAGQARGRMETTPDWRCRSRHALKRIEEEGDVASLLAKRPGLSSLFAAFAIRDPHEGNFTFFIGGRVERSEGMRISRVVSAAARASTFVFDHQQGKATVDPPWPFLGSAAFQRAEHGPNSWKGSVRAPLLGGGLVSFVGRDVTATLKRDFPSD